MKTKRDTTDNVVFQMMPFINKTVKKDSLILEPSAGKGNLIEGIIRHSDVDLSIKNFECVETNHERREILKLKGHKLVGSDFMQYIPGERRYDMVVACPPFKNNIDIDHIIKMSTLVKKGGRIVTLTSPRWILDNTEKSKIFRNFLSGTKYFMVMLTDESFIEKEKTVPTAILVIDQLR